MSAVYVSRGDGDTMEVRVGKATIVITELRIRPMSNFTTPHEVLGRGGSRLALTSEQMIELVAQYILFAVSESVHVTRKQVGYNFDCQIKEGV